MAFRVLKKKKEPKKISDAKLQAAPPSAPSFLCLARSPSHQQTSQTPSIVFSPHKPKAFVRGAVLTPPQHVTSAQHNGKLQRQANTAGTRVKKTKKNKAEGLSSDPSTFSSVDAFNINESCFARDSWLQCQPYEHEKKRAGRLHTHVPMLIFQKGQRRRVLNIFV